MATQPIDAPTPLYAILGTIPALPRPILRALATRIIDRLDELDGDPDLEGDDEGDPLDFGEGQAEAAILPLRPLYGIDQTRGPINEVEAVRRYLLSSQAA